ncbi:MAG TPA: tetratricopeptide repeat protein, partial [Mucilaginibacter sp.]
NVDALYGQAEIHFINAEKTNEKSGPADAKENYLKSIDLNNKATNCDPKCFRAYYMEGLAQNKVGEHEAAAMTFAGAISSNPFNYQVLIERGNTFFGLKKFEEAIKDYSATLQLLSANDNSTSKDTVKDNKIREANINLLLGEALYYNAYIYNKSSYDDARETLTKAIKLNEDNAEANYYMGLTYYAESDMPAAKNDYFSKANSYLDEAIDKNGTDYRYFYQRARTHDKRKKFADAIKDYTKVLDLDKLNLGKDTRYLRGLCYFRKKLTKEALDDFKLYKSDPNAETDTSFYADYSFVLLCSNQDLLAFNTLSKVMGAGPYHPKVSFALACYYYAKDDQLKSTATAQLKLADDLLEKAFASKKLSKDDLKFMKDVFIKRLNPNNGSYERLDKRFTALIKDYHNF